MALATSNLSVASICTALGVSNAKAIFYTSTGLKTWSQLAALVNKDGLNAAYCPGATADDRLASLLDQRRLSYFKGYTSIINYLSCSPTSLYPSFDGADITFNISANINWTITEAISWISLNTTSGSGNDTITVTVDFNYSVSDRTVSFTVQGSGITKRIYITQAGNPRP